MAELKTKKNRASVTKYLEAVEHPQRKKDAKQVLKLMKAITGAKASMWGTSIVGFGSYEGSTGEWPKVGFSARKTSLVLYVLPGFSDYASLLAKLGKHKTGKSCLYINKLDDVDTGVLETLISRSYAEMTKKYG